MMQQQPRSQSVSRVELYSTQQQQMQMQQSSSRQVSFRSSPPGSGAAAPARRSQSSMRALATPRHYPLSMPNHPPGTTARASSAGRAVSEAGAAAATSFTLDYDDPEEVTRAILRLREQRERDAAERSASRTRSRGKARETAQSQQQQQVRPLILEQRQQQSTSTSTTVPSNAVRQQQLQQLQQALDLQKSQSQGSSTHSHTQLSDPQQQQQNHAATSAKLYRSPSPSLAQRQGPSGGGPVAQSLSLQSSSSTENHYQSATGRSPGQPEGKTASATSGSGSNNHSYRPTSAMRGQQGPPPSSTHGRLPHSNQQMPTPRMANGQQQQQPPPPPPPQHSRKQSPSPQQQQTRHQPLQPPASRMVDPNGDEVEIRGNSNSNKNGPVKQAEKRIDGLLQELEELRFFHELDTDNNNSPPQATKVLGAMRPTTPTSNGNSNGAPRIPQMIGVPEGTASNKLPPPPINFMDPREISKLDRHTLELETQKMVRSVQLLTSEKMAIEAEMEVLTTDQTQNKKRIQQLEQSLNQVKQQLVHAKKEMDALRITTVKQYESRLSENVEKLQQTQKQVDGLRDERESLRADLEKRNSQLTELKQRSKTELREEREAAQAREAVLELQLAEVINTVEELKLKIKRKDDEVDDLRQQVQDARQAVVTAKKQHEASHQVQLQALHEQVAMMESKYKRAVDEREQVQQHLESEEKQLEHVRQQSEEQAALIADLTERLDAVHTDYRQKFGELKETYEAKEKRRLSEMVVSQSKQVEDYERRILSMQQQLTMATDRHHTEIRQKEVDIESKLEKERKKVREQLQDEHRRATERLRFDLDATKQDFEEAENERLRLREALAAPNKEHLEAQKEWGDRDARQQQEISRLRQQMERLSNESSDKESRILELTMKLTDRSKKHEERLNDMESQHAGSLLARDEIIAEQKRKLRESELTAKAELSRKESEFRDGSDRLERRISELEADLAHSKTLLEQSTRSLQGVEASSQELTALNIKLERLTSQLDNERKTNEKASAELRDEIASLKCKLQSSEATLSEKLAIIDDLEVAMKRESKSHSDVLRETQQQYASLDERLSENRRLLATERIKIEEQAIELARLEQEKQELLVTAESSQSANVELVAKVESLEHSIDALEHAKQDLAAQNAESLGRLQANFASEKSELEAKISELQANEKILRQENDELQESCDVIEANIRRLRAVNEELEAKAAQLPKALVDLARLKEQLSSKEDELTQTSDSLSQAKQELVDTRLTIEEYENKLSETTNMTSDLEKRAQQASHVSDLYASTAKQLRAKIESEQEEKATIKAQLDLTKKELRQKEQELAKLSSIEEEVAVVSSSREVLQRELNQLKSELEEKATQVKQLEEQLKTVALSRSRHIEEVQEQKSSDIKALEDRVFELETSTAQRKEQLATVENELAQKSRHLDRLQERHSAELGVLEEQISDLATSTAAAEAKMRVVDAELVIKSEQIERLEKTLSETREREERASRLSEELRAKLHRAEADLRDHERRMDEQSQTSDQTSMLQAELHQLTKVKSSLESKIRDLQDEQEEREKHVRQSAERYSNQIVELQMQVEDLTAAKTSLRAKLSEAEEELEKSADALRSSNSVHSADLNSLHQRLAEQLEAKNSLTSRVEDLESQLAVAQRTSESAVEKETMIDDLQNQVDAAAKESRSLKLRIGDVEQELDRKEKQIKEVVNRYSQEVATLSDKLESQTKECRTLQKELDQHKCNLVADAAVSSDTNALQDRVASLEKAIDVERALTRDAEKAKKRVEKEMASVESSKSDLQERFEKVTSERNEVIAALEEVIHEVQSREDEIDALADALRRREEELEHARMIASKALSSAQEIKARYKDRNSGADSNDRSVELEDQVASLTAALGQMKKNNNSLQRKLARLEEELTKKEGEYSELKERLQNSSKSQSNGKMDQYVPKSHPAEPPACSYNESASTAASSVSGGTRALDSPSRSLAFTESMSDLGADPWGMQPISTSSSDSSDNSASFAGVRAEPNDKKSIERNALRKYVRKRYMSAKSASST